MNRRNFSKQAAFLFGSSLTLPYALPFKNSSMRSKRYPRQLTKGSTVALIAPGSSVSDEKIEKAQTNLKMLGLNVEEGRFLREEYGYTAGRDNQRIADLHWAFASKHIDGIWCVRGGYGCTRLLPHLDYSLIKKNPKVFIGYSDITALNLAIYQKTGLITFHGPVASSEFTPFTLNYLQQTLISPKEDLEIKAKNSDDVQILSPGSGQGKLIGGNLSLISAMCGSKYLPSAKNQIVFLEDIEEKPYRIDRMLVQLKQAWELEKAKGILLGEFKGCDSDSDRSLTLLETFENHFKDCGIPVLYRVPHGHIEDQATYPVGVKAQVDTSSKRIKLLDQWMK